MREKQSPKHDSASCSVRSDEAVSLAAEMQGLVYGAAEPVRPGETVKAQQRRAWEALRRPPYWRVRAAWYGEAGCWSGVAVDDMRRRARALRKQEAGTREQARSLEALYATVAERLRASPDAEFHSNDIAALLHAARVFGAVGRPVADAAEEND